MRAIRNIAVGGLCLSLILSTIIAITAFTVLRSISPGLVTAAFQSVGGLEEPISRFVEHGTPIYSGDAEIQAAVKESWYSVLTPDRIEGLIGELLEGYKRHLGSAGEDATPVLNLKPLKTAFLAEYEKNMPRDYEHMRGEIEESVPDAPSPADVFDVKSLSSVSQYFKTAMAVPWYSLAVVAVATFSIALLYRFSREGLSTAGTTILIAGLLALGITFVLVTPLTGLMAGPAQAVLDGIPMLAQKLDFERYIPAKLTYDTAEMGASMAAYVIGQARVVAGIFAAVGLALSLIRVGRKAKPAAGNPAA